MGASPVENAPARRPADLQINRLPRQRGSNTPQLEPQEGETVHDTHDEGTGRFPGCTLEGDGSAIVSGVASPASARAEDLIYVDSPRHLDRGGGFRSARA